MLTIFTIPKAFHGHTSVIQRNAIQSWTKLGPDYEVILFGDDDGTSEIAAELGLRHIPEVNRNEYGTPLLNDLFDRAQKASCYSLLCYVNADIILMGDFLPPIKQAQHKLSRFLIVGRRWDIELTEPINYSDPEWEHCLQDTLHQQGALHSADGMDYFIFTRDALGVILPFAIGRTGWDNWLVYRACSIKVPVIDASKTIIAVHQNHDYSHYPGAEKGVFKGVEAKQNYELMGGSEHSFCSQHARWLLTSRGVKRALTPGHLYWWLDSIPVLAPSLRFLGIPKKIYLSSCKNIRIILGKSQKRD